MTRLVSIAPTKQANIPHYIKEWADHRGYRTQTDLAVAIGADKSLISRWYKGATPSAEWQDRLADLFHCERESLFRHPDDDWLSQFFKDRTKEELARMKTLLEAAFPRQRNGTDG